MEIHGCAGVLPWPFVLHDFSCSNDRLRDHCAISVCSRNEVWRQQPASVAALGPCGCVGVSAGLGSHLPSLCATSWARNMAFQDAIRVILEVHPLWESHGANLDGTIPLLGPLRCSLYICSWSYIISFYLWFDFIILIYYEIAPTYFIDILLYDSTLYYYIIISAYYDTRLLHYIILSL